MRWLPLIALGGCGIIEIVDKDVLPDTAGSGAAAGAYPYVLIGDRSPTDPSASAGIDIEGIQLTTLGGSTYYATVVQECSPGPGVDHSDCNAVTGSPGSETVPLGGEGGTLVVSFGGESPETGDSITVWEDGYEDGELYDIYVGDSASSGSGTWVTCAAGATGKYTCEVP